MADKPVHKKNTFALGAAATLVVLCLTAGLLELAARIAVKPNDLPKPPERAVIDPYAENPFIRFMRPYLYFHIPGADYVQKNAGYEVEFKINSLGFRDRAPDPVKKKKRLLLVGDSMVEGHGSPLDKTFASLLNQRLAPKGWRVLNCGTSGASPLYYAANLPRYLALAPDAVLIFGYDNDLYEDRVYEEKYFTLPMMDKPESLIFRAKTPPLLDLSRGLAFLRRTFRERRRTGLERIIQDNMTMDKGGAEQAELSKLNKFLVHPSRFDRVWGGTEKYLNYFRQTLESRGVRLLAADLGLYLLDPSHPKQFKRHALMQEERFQAWAASGGTPFLSILPLIEKESKTRDYSQIMIPQDHHPTGLGHELIARAIGDWLEKQLAQ